MEAACIWFIYAAARMSDNFRYGRTSDPEDFRIGPGCKTFAARGWKVYERDRWEAWRWGKIVGGERSLWGRENGKTN